jgi:hypothetical protein
LLGSHTLDALIHKPVGLNRGGRMQYNH